MSAVAEKAKLKAILAGPPVLIFDAVELVDAADAWGFSCGPAALCALFGRSPEGIRGYLPDFRGFMNPTMMYAALRAIGAQWGLSEHPGDNGLAFPRFGLVRIQWGGPWMAPSVPIPARYRRTHWAAVCRVPGSKTWIYDVNSPRVEWLKFPEWKEEIVPWILENVPRNDGTWKITHSIEVAR